MAWSIWQILIRFILVQARSVGTKDCNRQRGDVTGQGEAPTDYSADIRPLIVCGTDYCGSLLRSMIKNNFGRVVIQYSRTLENCGNVPTMAPMVGFSIVDFMLCGLCRVF